MSDLKSQKIKITIDKKPKLCYYLLHKCKCKNMNELFSKKIARPNVKYFIKHTKVSGRKLIPVIMSAFLCLGVGIIGVFASFSNNNLTAKANNTEVKLLSINTNNSALPVGLITTEDTKDQKPEIEIKPEIENKKPEIAKTKKPRSR